MESVLHTHNLYMFLVRTGYSWCKALTINKINHSRLVGGEECCYVHHDACTLLSETRRAVRSVKSIKPYTLYHISETVDYISELISISVKRTTTDLEGKSFFLTF